MRRVLLACFIFTECAPAPASPVAAKPAARVAVSAASVSAECLSARDVRSKATELDAGGHEVLALAKLDEANAACPTERVATMALEVTLLARTGKCAQSRELAKALDAASVTEAKATCDALDAPSKGTAVTMRAKMREAYAAEQAKDYPRAKTLYLDAWTELHPNVRALESAARMASLAGDAAESRRNRDRTLIEAEASEHARAEVTNRLRLVRGSPRLAQGTLTLAQDGKVVSRDLATGELRVLLDATGGDTTLSAYGTLAFVRSRHESTSTGPLSPLSVYDLLSGTLLFKVADASRYAVSSGDTLLAIREPFDSYATNPDVRVRVIDVATGEPRTKLSGHFRQALSGEYGLRERVELMAFAPDNSHLMLFGDGSDAVYRQWDMDKASYTSARFVTTEDGVGGASLDGHMLVYIGPGSGDKLTLHVRDLVENKELAQWDGHFAGVQGLAVSLDGSTVATGSYGSLRLWSVKDKKQTQVLGADHQGTDPRTFAFSDDGKTVVVAGSDVATSWDVATGSFKSLGDQPTKNVLRVVPAPDGGAAIMLEDEVRILPASGEPRTVCVGMKPKYYPYIGPTNVAFSPSGKSFACSMADGWFHVFDTATWTERALVKRGASAPASRPVDLVLSADDKTLTVVSDTDVATYDAQTATQLKKVTLRHPKVGLAARHMRFMDGTIAVRTWTGTAAIFSADGAYQRDVKLVSAPIDALDDFSSDGTTYAVAIGKALHVVDLGTGQARIIDLPSAVKSLVVSADGKTFAIASSNGVSTVSGDTVTAVPHASSGTRAWMLGKTLAVLTAKDTIELRPSGAGVVTLEIDPGGVVARDDAGGFEVRGKPELECVVGTTFLTRETCQDRAKDDIVNAWLRAVSLTHVTK